MKNPLLKNNKTETFDDLQNRTSHYNRILAARSLYDKNPKIRSSFLNHIHCKQKYNSEQQRKCENKKLVKSLLQIDQKYSFYSMHKSSDYSNQKSLKNQYSQKKQHNKIIEENMELYKKLVKTGPEIGSNKQWKTRCKKLKKYQKLLNNRRDNFLRLDQQFYNTFSKMKKSKTEMTSQLKVEFSKRQSLRDRFSQRFSTQGNNIF